jgi:hypothetical protein
MIRQLCDRLHALLRPASAKNGKDKLSPHADALTSGYRDLRRLTEQIKAHAERAPYPHVAARLRQIASEKQRASGVLKEKILAMGYDFEEPHAAPRSGKNHWQRMVQDLEDQKSLEAFLLEHATLLADDAPEIGDLLSRIAADQGAHRDILLDLVARADPQAEQS